MTIDVVKTCGEYGWFNQPAFSLLGNHVCPPKWYCWEEENWSEDDADLLHATDAEDAAEKFMEKQLYEDASWTDEMIVCVKGILDDEVKRFRVTAESVPQFSADEIENRLTKENIEAECNACPLSRFLGFLPPTCDVTEREFAQCTECDALFCVVADKRAGKSKREMRCPECQSRNLFWECAKEERSDDEV